MDEGCVLELVEFLEHEPQVEAATYTFELLIHEC